MAENIFETRELGQMKPAGTILICILFFKAFRTITQASPNTWRQEVDPSIIWVKSLM